jgi:Integrase core domain
VPFASPNGLCNLSKLSVWWLRLGIAIARIKPGHPQQNGRHERMHLTLKKEATRTAGMNSLQQQARFYDFIHKARDVATGLIGLRSLESVVLLTGDRGFESISLQRRVDCEPESPDQGAEPVLTARPKSAASGCNVPGALAQVDAGVTTTEPESIAPGIACWSRRSSPPCVSDRSGRGPGSSSRPPASSQLYRPPSPQPSGLKTTIELG